MANKQDFEDGLNKILIESKKLNLYSIEIISKDLHDSIALKGENSMPNCCNAMKGLEKVNFSKMEVTHDTESGQSTTMRMRYYL